MRKLGMGSLKHERSPDTIDMVSRVKEKGALKATMGWKGENSSDQGDKGSIACSKTEV